MWQFHVSFIYNGVLERLVVLHLLHLFAATPITFYAELTRTTQFQTSILAV